MSWFVCEFLREPIMLYRRSVTNKHNLSLIYVVTHFLDQHRQISIDSARFMNNIVNYGISIVKQGGFNWWMEWAFQMCQPLKLPVGRIQFWYWLHVFAIPVNVFLKFPSVEWPKSIKNEVFVGSKKWNTISPLIGDYFCGRETLFL